MPTVSFLPLPLNHQPDAHLHRLCVDLWRAARDRTDVLFAVRDRGGLHRGRVQANPVKCRVLREYTGDIPLDLQMEAIDFVSGLEDIQPTLDRVEEQLQAIAPETSVWNGEVIITGPPSSALLGLHVVLRAGVEKVLLILDSVSVQFPDDRGRISIQKQGKAHK